MELVTMARKVAGIFSVLVSDFILLSFLRLV